MSVLRLHENLILNPEQEYTCADFSWTDMYDNKNSANIEIIGARRPDLQHNFWALAFKCNFYAADDETQTKFQLLNFEGATPLCDAITPLDIDWQASPRRLKDSLFTEIFPGYEGDINADDAPVAMKVRYAQLTGEMASGSGRTIYTKAPSGQWRITTFNEKLPTSKIPAYYKCSKNFSRYFICNDGLRNVTFGARSEMSVIDPLYVGSGSFDDLGSVYTNNNMFGLRLYGGSVYEEGTSFRHHFNVDTYLQNIFQGIEIPLGATYPVHMVVKAGTYTFVSGSDIKTYNFDKDTIFFGTAAYSIKSDGDFGSVIVQVAQDNLFKSYKSRKGDMGADTDPAGGRGPFKVGTGNPFKDVTKAKRNGISTDPTAGSGFYVYRFTDKEWSDFLEWTGNVVNSGENVSNIKFMYKSPLKFTTKKYTLKGIKIGSTTIGKPVDVWGNLEPYDVQVVQDTTLEYAANITSPWKPETFSDLEPYSSTSVTVPFCASVQIPPSILSTYDKEKSIAQMNVKIYYELLSRAASASIEITRTGEGNIKYNAFGECAAECPSVLKRDVVGDIGKQLAPTVAAGVATIATGGTTAPLLVGTAAGAASGFTQMSTNMAQVNLPNISSSGPYWDTVNSGLYKCSVQGIHTPRLTSGETSSGGRSDIIGYASGYYIDQLGHISDGTTKAYVEVESVKMPLGEGMSKAQADKIVALLKEGVLI